MSPAGHVGAGGKVVQVVAIGSNSSAGFGSGSTPVARIAEIGAARCVVHQDGLFLATGQEKKKKRAIKSG